MNQNTPDIEKITDLLSARLLFALGSEHVTILS